MSALEQEVIEKFRQLDEAGKQRVLQLLKEKQDEPPFDDEAWLKDLVAFRDELRQKYDQFHFPSTLDLLDQIREEASWPRW